MPEEGPSDFISRAVDERSFWGGNRAVVSGMAPRDECSPPLPAAPSAGARNVLTLHVVGDQLLRVSRDAASPALQLDRVPLADATRVETSAALDLSRLADAEAHGCVLGAGWGNAIFGSGHYAYLPHYVTELSDPVNVRTQSYLTLYVIDLQDPEQLRVERSISMDPLDDYGNFSGILQTEHALLVGRTQNHEGGSPSLAYDIFDLSDPGAPRLRTRFDVPHFRGDAWAAPGDSLNSPFANGPGRYDHARAQVAGDLIVSQHLEALNDGTGLVRYYLDRLDVSDPAHPQLLPPINMPGTLVHFLPATGELVTVDYELGSEPGTEQADCQYRGAYGSYDYEANDCSVFYRRLNSLVLAGDRALLRSQVPLDRSRHASNLAASDARVFFTTSQFPPPFNPVTSDHGPDAQLPSEVQLESLRLEQGRLVALPSLVLRSVPNDGAYSGLLLAQGDRALEIAVGSLRAIGSADPLAPVQLSQPVPDNELSMLEFVGNKAYAAISTRGIEIIELP